MKLFDFWQLCRDHDWHFEHSNNRTHHRMQKVMRARIDVLSMLSPSHRMLFRLWRHWAATKYENMDARRAAMPAMPIEEAA